MNEILKFAKEKLLAPLILGLLVALFQAYMDIQFLKGRVSQLERDRDEIWVQVNTQLQRIK